jgi:hypothetical protein
MWLHTTVDFCHNFEGTCWVTEYHNKMNMLPRCLVAFQRTRITAMLLTLHSYSNKPTTVPNLFKSDGITNNGVPLCIALFTWACCNKRKCDLRLFNLVRQISLPVDFFPRHWTVCLCGCVCMCICIYVCVCVHALKFFHELRRGIILTPGKLWQFLTKLVIRLFSSMVQRPLVNKECNKVSRLLSDTPHWIGLLWTSDHPDAVTSTWQQTTHTGDRHQWTRRDSGPQSQQAQALEREVTGIGGKLFANKILLVNVLQDYFDGRENVPNR